MEITLNNFSVVKTSEPELSVCFVSIKLNLCFSDICTEIVWHITFWIHRIL